MGKVWKEIKYWSQILLVPVYFLSYLIPRDKNLWVFGSTFGQRFADNPKYFYLYVAQYKSHETKAVWISKQKDIVKLLRSENKECCYLFSLKGIWYSLRAGVYLYDNYSKDICYTLSGGAIKINLWHGIPLKKIQKDNIFDFIRNPRNIREKLHAVPRRISDEKPRDYVLSASEYCKPIFSSAFRTKNVLANGYPRNDILISDRIKNLMSEEENLIMERLTVLKSENQLVLYLPTFRQSETIFFNIIDLESFGRFLTEQRIIFCVKLHPKSKLKTKFDNIACSHIVTIDPMADPYPLCKISDILITDYSSIYFDYLLTGKPIIFFPYDYQEYLKESRELYFNYEDFTPGMKVRNPEELCEALTGADRFENERNKLRNILFNAPSDLSSESLYQKIRDICKNGKAAE